MYNIIKIELFWSLEVTFSHFYFLFILGFIAHIKITVNLRKFFNYLFRVLFQHIKYILRQKIGQNLRTRKFTPKYLSFIAYK